uniref:Cell division control protein 48 homolog C-like n=1 Tax=Rhizophora mucronata TaxID=61149 RepID=A0A2P2IVI7_RHIMU
MGKGSRGGGGGGGRNLERLRRHVESFRKKYSDADDIVHHLREREPNYRRMEQRTLTRLVQRFLHKSLPIKVHKPKEKQQEEEEQNNSYVNRSQSRKKQKRIDESEERLLRIENEYSRRVDRNLPTDSSDSGSSSSPPSSSAVSTSEDAIYGEKVEPEFDLMQSMLRESYAPPAAESKEEKNVELEVASNSKAENKVDMTKGGKRLGAAVFSRKEGLVSNASVEDLKGKDGPWFRDLGGMAAVLEELVVEVLVPLCHPHLPRRLGVNPISGVLLHGPPGCGKTKLAHALANETGIPFYKISATEVVSGVSGASEENIRDLFSKAHRTAPSIIFIDEIDVIASKRENLQREMERRIVTQLMTCMDEFYRLAQPSHANSDSESSDQRLGCVLVIGATNRPDAIDPALRRPGRFDREIRLGVPDENARKEILSVLTQKCTLEGSIDILQIARSTPGFVGADLAALVNKAGNVAMRRILSQRKSELCRESKGKELDEEWYKVPWLPEEIEKLAITMVDFEEAAKLVQPSSKREGFSAVPNVRWEDVGGLDNIRKELDIHIVGCIMHPEYYEKFGLKLETGILLYGPPGCGKTLIAKAVAREAGANFIYIKGPEILDKYVGESELAVRTLFNRARACSPCILFFDEVCWLFRLVI